MNPKTNFKVWSMGLFLFGYVLGVIMAFALGGS